MSEEMILKVCPFCGGEASIAAMSLDSHLEFWVLCAEGCGFYTPHYITEAEAVAAWNRRTPEPGTSVVRWVRYDKTNDDTLPEPGKEVLVLNRYDGQTMTIASLGVTQRDDPTYGDELGFLDAERQFVSELRDGDLWAYLPEPPEGMG